MKALSDPGRVKIVKMLQRRPMCVCEIHTALDVSQPTASKHLKILEDAGLIDSRKEGQWVNYFLSDGSRSPYAATLLGNMKHWLEDEPAIVDLIERLPNIDRTVICGRAMAS
jgi:ArsR family transcriptional regulator